jgi:L-histidine Nalpha-methyltransferase
METTNTLAYQTFEKDIINGLKTNPKSLPAKYFYDKKGDALFQQIMQLDEYYLTRSEYEILNTHKKDILKFIQGPINIVELGAGDGYKTKVLLQYLLQQDTELTYNPIDISGNALNLLQTRLEKELPELRINPIQGDYFQVLEKLRLESETPKLILFLGSTIGNFNHQQALDFLIQLRISLSTQDLLLIGADLVKDPDVILKAYNDAKGVTQKFNFNLLHRINKELDANFNPEKFKHFPLYDPVKKAALSYLISIEDQKVHFPTCNETILIKKWEPVFMETSQKYELSDLHVLASKAGFEVVENFMDSKQYFTDSLWKIATID